MLPQILAQLVLGTTLKGLEIGEPERPSEGTALFIAEPVTTVVLRDVQPTKDHTALFLPVVEDMQRSYRCGRLPRDGAGRGPHP